MSNEITGWTPVATVEEAEGVTMWEVAEDANEHLAGTDAEIVFLDEIHGDIYLAYRHTDDNPEWERLSAFEAINDACYDATDDLAEYSDGKHAVVAEIGVDNERHLVYTGEP
jgi:hypothetical protein